MSKESYMGIFDDYLRDFHNETDTGHISIEDLYYAFRERMVYELKSSSKLYLDPVTPTAQLPEKKTTDAACYDLRADLFNRNVTYYRSDPEPQVELCKGTHLLYPGERALIPTGFKMCCDPGWKLEVAPRSGNSIKHGVTLINCTGIIDADFRDEAMILIINHDNNIMNLYPGMRIAQLSLERVYEPSEIVIGPLPETNSNRKGGMGSTGHE